MRARRLAQLRKVVRQELVHRPRRAAEQVRHRGGDVGEGARSRAAEEVGEGAGEADRAGQAGALRGDTTGADLFTLMNAAAWSREHDTREQADRLLELALAGMLAATPPPARA
ncbi:hypothetical protein [Kitasatospora griseola]|uniref:SbtR family transcriptional regulator n=1 Tax=Kitasatospora griseola TaxID=2064 RepID=UPI002E135AF0